MVPKAREVLLKLDETKPINISQTNPLLADLLDKSSQSASRFMGGARNSPSTTEES